MGPGETDRDVGPRHLYSISNDRGVDLSVSFEVSYEFFCFQDIQVCLFFLSSRQG